MPSTSKSTNVFVSWAQGSNFLASLVEGSVSAISDFEKKKKDCRFPDFDRFPISDFRDSRFPISADFRIRVVAKTGKKKFRSSEKLIFGKKKPEFFF